MPRKGEGFDDVETTARPKADTVGAPARAFLVRVVGGPDVGKELVIDGASPTRILIGKSPICDLVLSDVEVSRRHAALDIEGDRLRLRDLGSTNGSFVEGIFVRDASLRGGETITLGATTLTLFAGAGAATPLSTSTRFGRLVGGSSAMRRLYPLCTKLAQSSVPVIIEGETGTGKEVLAEAIHEVGPRAKGPFVVFDCTAMPANLLEAALFGHERGAFTGAVDARPGVFEEADGGTLLIDEIGDLDIALQAKLLRAIERSEVRRLGGKGFVHVDVRVLAATRRDLDHEVQAGRFRDDLFFRLAVARVELPALREREGDIRLLTQLFWTNLGGEGSPPRDVLARFETHSWPGNVRELRNAVARQIALGADASAIIGARSVSPQPRTEAPPDSVKASRGPEVANDPFGHILALDLPLPRARQMLITEFERAYVERVLARHGGSVVRAAEASGLARRYFQLLRAKLR